MRPRHATRRVGVASDSAVIPSSRTLGEHFRARRPVTDRSGCGRRCSAQSVPPCAASQSSRSRRSSTGRAPVFRRPGALLTRRGDGTLVLALWNYAEIGSIAKPRKVVLTVQNSAARTPSGQSLDAEHGNVLPAYVRMGSPRYPTQRQLAELRAAAALPAPVARPLDAGTLSLEIAPDGLALVTIAATRSDRE